MQLSGAVQRGVAGQSRALALLAHGVVSHRAYWPRVHIQQCPQEMLNGMTARSPGLMWLADHGPGFGAGSATQDAIPDAAAAKEG